MSIPTVSDSLVQNLMRGIRTHIDNLLPVVEDSHMMRMRLGLAHSLDRYKLKCNPDKIDTMIVQAVGKFTYCFYYVRPHGRARQRNKQLYNAC